MLRPLLVSCLVILLLPLTVPTAAQTAVPGAKDLEIIDPVGDVGTGLPGQPGIWDHVDLERLVVGRETADSFSFVLDFVGRSDPATLVGEATAVTDLSCSLDFRYDEGHDHRYSVYTVFDDLLDPGGAQGSGYAYMYQDIYTDNNYIWNRYDTRDGDFAVTWDDAAQAIAITIPKAIAEHPGGYLPSEGVELRLGWVSCRSSYLLTSISDSVRAEEGVFRFRSTGPGSVVSVRFGDHVASARAEDVDGDDDGFYYESRSAPVSHEVALAAGEVNVVPVTLTNLVDAKRIVNLAARANARDGSVLPWNVSLAPTVALNSEEARLVKLIVVPPAAAEPGESVSLSVELSVLGAAAPGLATTTATVAPILGPGLDTYRFFTKPTGGEPTDVIAPGFTKPAPRVTMSLLGSPEGWTQEPVQAAGIIGGTYHWSSLGALARPVRLDPDGQVVLTLHFTADTPGELGLWFDFEIGDETLHSAYESVPVGEPVEIRRSVTGATDLSEGSPVFFSMGVYGEFPDSPVNPVFHPEASSFRLPLLAPPEQELNVTDGRFLPTLSLAPGEERETYINPGGVHTFEMVVANEGVETDDLRITVRNENDNATGWTIDVKPGKAFRIPAGNATRFGIEVTAPRDVPENEHVGFLVEAVSKHDPAAKARFRLALTATTTLEFEDKVYEEGEDQIPALPERDREAPLGVLPLSLVLVALAAVLWRRRMT